MTEKSHREDGNYIIVILMYGSLKTIQILIFEVLNEKEKE